MAEPSSKRLSSLEKGKADLPVIEEMEEPMEEPCAPCFVQMSGKATRPRDEEEEEEVEVDGTGHAKKPAAEKLQPAPRAPTSAAFVGMGTLGGLAASALSNEDVIRVFGELFVGSSIEPTKLHAVMDAGIEGSGAGTGFRLAIKKEISRLAEEANSTQHKLWNVLWLSLRKAFRILQQGGDNAVRVREALFLLFPDQKGNRDFASFLTQTCSLLNGWSEAKNVCGGCSVNQKRAEELGVEKETLNTMYRLKSSDPSNQFVPEVFLAKNLPTKFRKDTLSVYVGASRKPTQDDAGWKPLLQSAHEGDIFEVAARPADGADFCFASSSEKSGFLPVRSLECMAEACSCPKWNTIWSGFCRLVDDSIVEVGKLLPKDEALLSQLKEPAESSAAYRVYKFLHKDVATGGGELRTSLLYSCLDQTLSVHWQASLFNLLDSEHDGNLRSWLRVLPEFVGVQPLENDFLVCQTPGVSRKVVASILKDQLQKVTITGSARSPGFGWMWRPENLGRLVCARRWACGWETGIGRPYCDGPTANLASIDDLVKGLSEGEFAAVPFPFLRGFEQIPEMAVDFVGQECRLVLVVCDVFEFFDGSNPSIVSQKLFKVLLKRWRKAVIIFGSWKWINWWKLQLVGIGSKREVITLRVGVAVGSEPSDALTKSFFVPSGQEICCSSEAMQAKLLHDWFDLFNKLSKDEKEKEKDGAKTLKVKSKKSLLDFFHSTFGPDYLLSVSNDYLAQADLNFPAGRALNVDHLSGPMTSEWSAAPAHTVIYGAGQGIVVSHSKVTDYCQALDNFLGTVDAYQKLERVWRKLDDSTGGLDPVSSMQFVTDALLEAGCPFTLARIPIALHNEFVHLVLGQDYCDGWTFATQVKGTSQPIRAVHRLAGLTECQFVTYDVLTSNHDWKFDFDYFVSCPNCRSNLCNEKQYESLKHITPALPKEPACFQCKVRWRILMLWIDLLLGCMIFVVSKSSKVVFVTAVGKVAQAVWISVCKRVPPWLKACQILEPSVDVQHPGASAFCVFEAEIRAIQRTYGKLCVELHSASTGTRSNRWPGGMPALYETLSQVFPPFDTKRLYEKRMRNVVAVRHIVVGVVDSVVGRLNGLLGKTDVAASIDLRSRTVRLIAQLELQRISTSEDLISVIDWFKVPKKESDKKNSTLEKVVDLTTRGGRRAFARKCYHDLMAKLREAEKDQENIVLKQLRLFGKHLSLPSSALSWKEVLCRDFEGSLKSVIGQLAKGGDPLLLNELGKVGVLKLLECLKTTDVARVHLDFTLVKQLLESLIGNAVSAPPSMSDHVHVSDSACSASTPVGSSVSEDPLSASTSNPTLSFRPVVPEVKVVPDTKYTFGMIPINRTLAPSIIVAAGRKVVSQSNLERLKVSSSDAEQIIKTVIVASFDRQRSHFGKGIGGSRTELIRGLKRMFERGSDGTFTLQSDNVFPASQESMQDACLLSLFDYKRVLAPSLVGSVGAHSDGCSLNLLGLKKGTKTSGRGKQFSDADELLDKKRKACLQMEERLLKEEAERVAESQRRLDGDPRAKSELEDAEERLKNVGILFLGLDCGKSGLDAALGSRPERKAVRFKAEAEAALSVAEKLPLDHGGREEEIEKADTKRKSVTLSESAARQLLEDQQVPTARGITRKNRSEKGALISQGCRQSELLEKSLKRKEEEALKRFDACVKKDHHELLKSSVPLSSVAFDATLELEAIQARLSCCRLLQVAYNSGMKKKQRRTRAMRDRAFTARATRMLTKELPEAVLRAGDKVLSKRVTLPKRSPQSRQREKIRGWERGVNRAMEVIASSKATCQLPLWIATDMFSGAGQRISSSFPFQGLYRSISKHIQSRPKLSSRIMIYIDNGFRSSRQAAGTLSYLANLQRADHRKVRALDLPADWLGPCLDGFGYFWCPVTNTLVKRDPPAAKSMSTIGTCTFFKAPHPEIWAHARSNVAE